MRTGEVVLALVVVSLLATPVAAHVPTFPTDNTTPERAVEVPDPAKSWSFYDSIDQGSAVYYRVSLDDGERLRVSTFTPDSGDFRPSVVVMGESVDSPTSPPGGVTVPEGMNATVVEGERPDTASYEPFAPSANYETASLDRTVDGGGDYLVAIYDPENRSGQAGVAVGYREEFSPVEYVTVPFDLVRTHLWEGQHPLVVVGPLFVTLVGGILLVQRRRPASWQASPVRYAVSIGGLLAIGTGLGTTVQILLAVTTTGVNAGVLVTAVFVAVPVICGVWVLRVALESESLQTTRIRAGLVVAGLLCLGTWGGYILGPLLFVVVALLPSQVYDTFWQTSLTR